MKKNLNIWPSTIRQLLCKFCVFSFLFLFKGSSKCGFFHLAVLFSFYRVLFLHYVFLSEQIKMMMMITRIIFFGRDVRTYAKARYTLATKLNSTQSTLLKVDKVDRVASAPYTDATKSKGRSTLGQQS